MLEINIRFLSFSFLTIIALFNKNLLKRSFKVKNKLKARDLGVPFEGETGRFNAITDVPDVEVGHVTLISGKGTHAVRTGVTAVLPTGKSLNPVFAGSFSLNGSGEMTGRMWLDESGFLFGPVMLTNTLSVGIVRDATAEWAIHHGYPSLDYSLPVVAETWDGVLNDIEGFHVKRDHAFKAIENSSSSELAEGNVGGGTGMICYDFKGGIGTSSRIVRIESGRKEEYVLGALVQANHGRRDQLRIAGVPAGKLFEKKEKERTERKIRVRKNEEERKRSSIIIVIGTNAPLLPHQLQRIARRASLGLARSGSFSANFSGDIFLAFSTSQTADFEGKKPEAGKVCVLSNESLNGLFAATVQATDEAIINALVAARTMEGKGGKVVESIPHDYVKELMAKYAV